MILSNAVDWTLDDDDDDESDQLFGDCGSYGAFCSTEQRSSKSERMVRVELPQRSNCPEHTYLDM